MANLTRYELTIQHGKDGEHVALYHAMENGEWVKFEDLEEFLKTSHNTASDAIEKLRNFFHSQNRYAPDSIVWSNLRELEEILQQNT